MRVPPPPSLRLSADALLRDVRERLAAQHPEVAASLDPTHPAWLVLQESAWMVETLSAQLDRYPWAVVQQLAHLLGARLLPALPALTVVTIEASEDGPLLLDEDPGRWRLFAPRNESRGLVEFALVERDLRVTAGRIGSLAMIRDGELCACQPIDPVPTCARFGPLRPSAAFTSERFVYTVRASAAERVEALLRDAATRLLDDRRLGWLRLSVEADAEFARLVATIDVNAAFRGSPPVTPGGDVCARWGSLDDSTWTPPVRVADHPLLPRWLRGSRPLAGQDPGELLVPDVPAGLTTSELLVRDAQPAPHELVDALWATLVNLETRLAPLRPHARRGVASDDDEPGWVDATLRSGAWAQVIDRPDASITRLDLQPAATDRQVLVGWIGAGERCRAFAIYPEGVDPTPLPLEARWRQRLPDVDGAPTTVGAASLAVPARVDRVLLVCDGAARATLLNPCLAVNAPLVRDGRRATVARATPEPVHLLHKDIVTADVLTRLARAGIDASVSGALTALALARFDTPIGPLRDLRGVAVDPADGLIVLNAPDDQGFVHPVARGERVRLTWYRRTDGDGGNLPAGSVRLVEQAPTARPRLTSVHQPVGAAHGRAREDQQAAIRRVFGPSLSIPVTPGDWERLIRHALGPRAEGWLLRVWGHAERSLSRRTLWPVPQAGVEASTDQLRDALKRAGPEVLLVALGPRGRDLDAAELAWAEAVIDGLIAEWTDRVPMIRGAIVTPLWGLTLRGEAPAALPAHHLLQPGTLRDHRGRAGPASCGALMLNAAVIEVLP